MIYKDVKDITVEYIDDTITTVRRCHNNVVVCDIHGSKIKLKFFNEKKELETIKYEYAKVVNIFKLSVFLDENGNEMEDYSCLPISKGKRKKKSR